MDCLKCGGGLDYVMGSNDHRIEWTSEQYVCSDCGAFHTRLTTYKSQSSLVDTDELTLD